MEAASIQAGSSQRRRSRGIPERRLARLMVSPSLILIAIVAAYPIAYAIWLSLHEYSVRVAGLSRWAGLKNYSTALQSAEFWDAVKTTFILTVVTAITWQTIFEPTLGFVNSLLGAIGLPNDTVWLGEQPQVLIVMIIA